MKKSILIVPLVILIACGIYVVMVFNTTAVVVSNWSSEELKNVKIETNNSVISIVSKSKGPHIKPQDSRTVRLYNPIGESGIKMTYNDGQIWQGGYIENRYKIRIIYDETGIKFEHIPFLRFLLRM